MGQRQAVRRLQPLVAQEGKGDLEQLLYEMGQPGFSNELRRDRTAVNTTQS